MEQDFIVGVIGDFSGGAIRKPERFLDMDRDDFAETFARLKPVVELGLPFCPRLELSDWEDWHPDRLADRVPALAALLEARDCAGDVGRMRELLAETGVSLDEAETLAPAAPETDAPEVSQAELLDDLLGGGAARGAPVRVARHVADPEFERLLAEIASPHAERIDHAGIAARRDAIDREIGARTRTLLRHPAFRAREALWRSLRALVWGSETGEGLRIRILDADPDSLRGDDAGVLADALHRLAVTDESGTLGGQPFGLLLVDAEIQAGDDADLALLGHLGRIAGEARVPCLVGAGSTLWRSEGGEAAEDFLAKTRAIPGAERIGLCAPRLLVRLPYGRSGDPVDRFAFEEVDEDTGSEGFTWGGAAFAVAAAAAEAVASAGDVAQTARFVQREGLPFHPRGRNADPIGPTEQVLPDTELERLRELRILPVAGVRGRDAAVIMSLESLTGAPLFGS